MCKILLAALLIILPLAACSAAGRPNSPKPMLHMTVSDMFPGNPQAQALAKAAEKGDIAAMDKLVAAGADPNATGEYAVTVPAWVVLHPNKEGFRRLLELGANPNKIWRREDSALDKSLMHFVVRETPNIGIEYLAMSIDIGKGNPNLRVGKYKSPPMEDALCPVCIPAFATLLKAGGDMYYIDWFGRTYAMSETTQNNFKLVLFLLENGVDYAKKDNLGYDIASSLQVKFKRSRVYKYPQDRDYMWFWRCIDFLEKRGATFTIPQDAIRPAVLDTTPPDIFAEAQTQQPDTPAKPRPRVSDTETVSMHEVSLTYPVPFWLQGADATTGNIHSRMRQKAGFLAYDYVPMGQDFDRWQSSLGISTLYAPGNTWPQFSKAVQEGYASACGKNVQIDVVQDVADHRVLHLRCGEDEHQEGYLYLGVFKSTFVTVYQGWRNASPADAERYRAAALQGVERIRLEPGMNVVPMP